MKPNGSGTRAPLLAVFVALASLTISSCGGGGASGGISGTGVVFGPLETIGATVTVNGIAFEAGGARVVVNGTPGTTDDLRLGMVVTVRGLINSVAATGTADQIDFNATLEGPVEAVDIGTATIQVLSALILTDAQTEFDGTSLATLTIGEVIEVSGFVDGDGLIRATRVELDEGSDEFEIEGTITNLDTVESTFDIGMLEVDFGDAEIEDAPPGGLADGLFVEVEGSTVPIAGVFIAEKIKALSVGQGGNEGDKIEIEGFVTSVASSTEFTLNGTTNVRITSATEFERGTAADILINARLEAEGTLDAGNVLVAEEIEFE